MKRLAVISIGILVMVAAITGADDQSPAGKTSRLIRVSKCQITLIDHVTVASDRSGILKHVEFKEGQSVVEGSLVALIEDDVAKANLAVAEKKASNDVEVKFAKAATDAAKTELEMAKKAGKGVSALDVDKAQLAYQKAQLSIEKAENDLELEKLNRDVAAAELKTYSVVAGFPGVITKIYKKKHEAVRQGDPIADIINTDRVRIEGRVNLSDLRYAKQGAKVLVRLYIDDLDLPEEKEIFEGRITFVDLVSEKIDSTTRVFAEVQNRDNILRAGLDAEMEIEVEDQAEVGRTQPVENDKNQKRISNASSSR